MTLWQAVVLGALQGITEFLPISSSGHLVLAEQVLMLDITPKNMQGLNVLLHAGTLLALLMAYAPVWWKLLRSPFTKDRDSRRQLALLLIATVPGAIAGLLLEEWIAHQFQVLLYVGLAFAITGTVLLTAEYFARKKHGVLWRVFHPLRSETRHVTVSGALLIGVSQACALVPGLSRSGLTVSAGRLLGLKRKEALDFSFLMAAPIIAGATVLSLKDVLTGAIALPGMQVTAMAVAVSFVSSVVAIMFLRNFVNKRGLWWFSPYLFGLSALIMAAHFYA